MSIMFPNADESVKAQEREKIFRRYWQYVRSVVWHDPAIVRKAWWDC